MQFTKHSRHLQIKPDKYLAKEYRNNNNAGKHNEPECAVGF